MYFLLDTTVIIFYISLLSVIGMIYIKYRELNNSNKFWYRDSFDKVDRKIINIIDFSKRILSLINKANAIALIQWIAYYILSWLRNKYIWLRSKARSHPPSRKVMDMIRGKGELKKRSGTSFFLRRIAEDDKV